MLPALTRNRESWRPAVAREPASRGRERRGGPTAYNYVCASPSTPYSRPPSLVTLEQGLERFDFTLREPLEKLHCRLHHTYWRNAGKVSSPRAISRNKGWRRVRRRRGFRAGCRCWECAGTASAPQGGGADCLCRLGLRS